MSQPFTRPDSDLVVRRIASWLDLMRTTDKLLLAGLQRKIGPDGDLRAAYRSWYTEQMHEHDKVLERIVKALAAKKQDASHGR